MEHCTECGFVYDMRRAGEVSVAIRASLGGVAALLAEPAPEVRRHPWTWSPLEYACHLRDVLLVQRERTLMARRIERPSFEPMGREERVEHDGYSGQRAEDVIRQLLDAGLLFGNVLDRLRAADWDRRVIYSYPALEERSLSWMAVHTLHEVVHHVADIRRQIP